MNLMVKFSENAQTFDGKFGQVQNVGGVADHTLLANRDQVDQHPIRAITGLEEALANAGGRGSGGEWELLQSYEHPEGAEELTGITITFPEEYNEFILIVNLKAPSATSNTILYPRTMAINSLGESVYGDWGFWDYYPGTNPERLSILFEKIVVNGTTYLRMSNTEHGSPIVAGKPASSYKKSCWWECDINNQKFVRWRGIDIKRKIAPLSNYILLGRK